MSYTVTGLDIRMIHVMSSWQQNAFPGKVGWTNVILCDWVRYQDDLRLVIVAGHTVVKLDWCLLDTLHAAGLLSSQRQRQTC